VKDQAFKKLDFGGCEDKRKGIRKNYEVASYMGQWIASGKTSDPLGLI